MAYATPAQLLERKSPETIGDLVSDDGVQVLPAALLTDDIVEAALEDASGAIEAALLQGQRYSLVDLATLTGGSLMHLVRMTCEIAMAYLYARKPTYSSEQYKAALELQDIHLERLRRGENVFNVAANLEAGVPQYATPRAVDIAHLQLIRDRARGFYPRRIDQTGSG